MRPKPPATLLQLTGKFGMVRRVNLPTRLAKRAVPMSGARRKVLMQLEHV